MSNQITECEELVSGGIPNEFNEADGTLVYEAPSKLVEWGSVSLWGQNLGTGNKMVNLRMPRILAWLMTLAASGTGPAEEYDDVRYKFMSSMLLPAALDHRRRMLTYEPHHQIKTPARLARSQASKAHRQHRQYIEKEVDLVCS
jgi:hypothetical protein